MKKKAFSTKLKADLALIAFVLVTVAMLGLTSVGVFAYAINATAAQPSISQSNDQPLSLPQSGLLTGRGG